MMSGLPAIQSNGPPLADRSSGMIHVRYRIDGKLRVNEGCNLDDAGAYDVIPDLPSPLDIAKLCRNDFPQAHDPKED